MSLFDTIIGREQLQSLTPEQQDQARSTARREFIINSLLGGRGLASGFEAARGVIPSMQAAQQRQRMNQARENAMIPMGVLPGSQLEMLNQQMGADNDPNRLPDPEGRTTAALRRVAGGTGMQGTGLTAQGQLLRQFDPTLYAQNVASVMDPTKPQDILSVSSSAAPVFDPTTGTFQDPFSRRVTGSMPVEARTPGVVRQLDPSTNQLVFGAGTGARQAIEDARPIDLAQGEEIIGRTPDGRVIIQNAIGAVYARGERETATALGQAAGQVERVYNPLTQQEELVPRTAIVGGIGAGGGAGGAQGAGGFSTGPSPDVEAVQRTRGGIFETRVKNIAEKASDAGRRSFQANQLYDTASRLDPTALTAFGAAIVPYIRAIPGLRDTTDQFATDTALFGQQYARGVLGNFANVKGNLNAQEVRLVEDANWQRWDPRTATRYVAALEAAFADKDAAQLEFANRFMDNPENKISEFDQSWQQNENNINVFNHPMMQRFVNDEVSEALSRGVEPNLPPGFTFGRSRSTGQPQVRTPDGSILAITQ